MKLSQIIPSAFKIYLLSGKIRNWLLIGSENPLPPIVHYILTPTVPSTFSVLLFSIYLTEPSYFLTKNFTRKTLKL